MGTVSNLAKFFKQQSDQLVVGDQRVQAGLTKSKLVGQRLTTAPLLAAGLDKSRNPVLQSLWEAVLDYNREWKHPSKMTDGERVRATAILDHIYKTCATYMTDKSFKQFKLSGAQARRKLRYDAFAALIVEVAKEIEGFGGKMLVGPTNFLENKRNYWLERLDPNHRAGYMISNWYNTWVNSGSTDSFWTWLQAQPNTPTVYDSSVAGYNNPHGAQWQFYRYFDAGLLYNAHNDQPFRTHTMKTEFSGDGWAVWVCSMPMIDQMGEISTCVFSYTHRAGWDHHSSFLGGQSVLAAGEWIVNNTGKITVMTGKSGHYMPKWENLHRFVTRFTDVPGDALIRPNMLDHANGTSTIKFYRVSDFRARSLLATPLRRNVVLAAIQSTGANTNIFEHFPRNGMAAKESLTNLLPP